LRTKKNLATLLSTLSKPKQQHSTIQEERTVLVSGLVVRGLSLRPDHSARPEAVHIRRRKGNFILKIWTTPTPIQLKATKN
jgi:hypothetical protein